jgi:hypothetical protein
MDKVAPNTTSPFEVTQFLPLVVFVELELVRLVLEEVALVALVDVVAELLDDVAVLEEVDVIPNNPGSKTYTLATAAIMIIATTTTAAMAVEIDRLSFNFLCLSLERFMLR